MYYSHNRNKLVFTKKIQISPDIIFLVHAYCIFQTFQVMMFMYHEYAMVLKCSIDFFFCIRTFSMILLSRNPACMVLGCSNSYLPPMTDFAA